MQMDFLSGMRVCDWDAVFHYVQHLENMVKSDPTRLSINRFHSFDRLLNIH